MAINPFISAREMNKPKIEVASGVTAEVRNGILEVILDSVPSSNAAWTTVATLPISYRPKANVYAAVVNENISIIGMAYVNVNGEVQVRSESSSTTRVFGNIVTLL